MHAGRHQRADLLEPVVERTGSDPAGQLPVVGAARAGRGGRRGPRVSAGSRASSRSTIRSALVATRAWNDRRPSVPDRTSPSTHSRTASTSSGQGRPVVEAPRRGSGGDGARASERSAGEQAEQVPLVLAHATADRGQLHRPRCAAQVAPRLHHADHAPLQACRAPPTSAARRGRPAGRRPPRRPSTSTSRVATPPAGSGEPNRHARTQNHPRSSSGSPRWASSQSRTARSPSWSTRRLPRRKSPCTTHGSRPAAAGWPPASGTRARRRGAARRARRGRRGTAPPGRSSDSPGTASTGMRWMAASAAPTWAPRRSRAVAHSSSRSSFRAIVSPASRSTTIPALPSTAPSSLATTPRDGHAVLAPPPAAAPAPCRPATPTPDWPSRPGRSRCRISSCATVRRRRGRTTTSPATPRPTAAAAPRSAHRRQRRAEQDQQRARSSSRPRSPRARSDRRRRRVRSTSRRRRRPGTG